MEKEKEKATLAKARTAYRKAWAQLIEKSGGVMGNKCNTCRCNRVCDHNEYGFEDCDNYISEWISVEERLPGKDEYLTHNSDGLDSLKRITIAYMTDTIEYTIGCYDGYKWLNQLGNRVIKDVIAWKPFDKYEPPKMQKEDEGK